MDEDEPQGTPEHAIAESIRCPECRQSYKTPQGLAGHRRLAHSTSSANALEERGRELEEHRQVLESRSAEIARRESTAKRHEVELARREAAAREIEDTPDSERVGRIVRREIASLPEVASDSILRVNGTDYRIQNGELRHLYWPKGEKTDFEEGERFQFGGRAYFIRSGRLQAVHSSAILASLLQEEE